MSLGLNEAASLDNGDVPKTWPAVVWKLTNRHGLWALVACALIYVFVWQMAPAVVQGNQDHAVIKSYLQALCLNAADTDTKIARCRAALPLANHE